MTLVEYAPGMYANLIRGNADSRCTDECASCGKPIGFAGMAARMGDRKPVHYMADRDRPGYVLDCVTEETFRSTLI
jgi:hypothetical protein